MKAKVLVVGAALGVALTAGAAASMDLRQDIVAHGANPDWRVKVEHGVQLTLSRPGKPALAATAPGAAMTMDGSSWSAKTADGQEVKLAVQTASCLVGTSQYPMTAQVTVGGETLSGCAGYTP